MTIDVKTRDEKLQHDIGEKQQKHHYYYQAKLINMNTLRVKNNYLLKKFK